MDFAIDWTNNFSCRRSVTCLNPCPARGTFNFFGPFWSLCQIVCILSPFKINLGKKNFRNKEILSIFKCSSQKALPHVALQCWKKDDCRFFTLIESPIDRNLSKEKLFKHPDSQIIRLSAFHEHEHGEPKPNLAPDLINSHSWVLALNSFSKMCSSWAWRKTRRWIFVLQPGQDKRGPVRKFVLNLNITWALKVIKICPKRSSTRI